ncbi:hypothetical protein Vafri_3872 [Volvox africanus]|uniref:Endonuclease/exonuclease/phosphatase domain-containing protein n=1 Tax=Volvox africanus TaxID=51714 RepID=A0A8J4AT55_9CHLO|nr:hypothetical protein Vafri_3872 [Volvox africanus]
MTIITRMTSFGANNWIARPLSNVGTGLARSRMVFKPVVPAAGKTTAEKTTTSHDTINVMTYNILAQKYAQSGWHNYCPSRHIRWDYRKALLLEELEAYCSDIICLQEVEAEVFSRELQPWLAERGYQGHYLARHHGENVQRLLLAAVTHLFWNPAFPDVKSFQAAVLCQEMATFLQRHARGGNGSGPAGGGGVVEVPVEEVPVVLAGDFNSLSHKRVPDVFDPKIPRGPDGLVSGVYTLLTRGSLPTDHPDHPASRRRLGETSNLDFRGLDLTTAGLRLASAYCLANGREPPLTTRTATFAGCLDYIFVSPQHFDVTSTLDFPYDLPLGSYDTVRDPLSDVKFPPIPNGAFPSDHLSLVALLKFKRSDDGM